MRSRKTSFVSMQAIKVVIDRYMLVIEFGMNVNDKD